ncbi:MAG TPA: putative zinc-binding metallopeptidase [Fimbriimonadaceae bacterium]|nr:putative zinc-binding metallopeptidase [Fimbriimonadaceae bacterium]
MLAPFLFALFLQPPAGGSIQDLETAYHLTVEELKKPLEWHGDHYVVKADPPSPAQLKAYEPLFVKEWSLYPPSYVAKAVVHRIVFGVDLSVDGQMRAAVPAFDGDTMFYDPALGSYNLHYQRTVIHHEFFHLVDKRMRLLDTDMEWSRLNPSGFHYGDGGSKMRTLGVGELTDKIPGFLTPYSTSAIEEDKAELFAHMIVDGPYVRKRASADPILAAKIALLRQRLTRFDPNMGEPFWSKVPGWAGYKG